jgi:hypothetical protein
MPKKVEVTTDKARQATTRPRTMIWVLWGSIFLCAMAGWVWPWDGSVFHSFRKTRLIL